MNTTQDASPRSTYRHGDLRDALVEAGLAMAREGGPDAVVIREATRRAGVSPNAAYRHFSDRQALVQAVSNAALGQVADRIEIELNATDDANADAIARARAMLRAVGNGYIAFAREEPGLFRVAFEVPDNLQHATDPAKAGKSGLTPFEQLSTALDALAAAGVLPPDRRANAEFLAWSAVHGLGMLVIDGPLRGLSAGMIDGATERLLDMVERGL